ncbi:MAG TPA: DinB family protein, partial [Terriglobales bacterium]|nr:DinB family protein [Terriglobales bacterium]
MKVGVDFNELLAYTGEENQRWKRWLKQHPEALAVSAGIAGEDDVAGLLVHIFAVELRYAERLLEQPATPYEKLRSGNLDEIFAIADRARAQYRQFLAQTNQADLAKIVTFETRSAGTLSASKRKILAHALLHGVRHWAQIATALRKA